MRRQVSRPLVLTADAAYQPAACVCLTSVFLATPDVAFTTHIFTDEPTEQLARAVARLRTTFDRYIAIARERKSTRLNSSH